MSWLLATVLSFTLSLMFHDIQYDSDHDSAVESKPFWTQQMHQHVAETSLESNSFEEMCFI